MKQYLRFFSGLAGIAILLTFTSLAQAAYIPIGYNGFFDESTDAPDGDIDSIGGTEDTALFQLIGTPEGFDNTFRGSVNEENDFKDSIVFQVGLNNTLTKLGITLQSKDFFYEDTFDYFLPSSDEELRFEVKADSLKDTLKGTFNYTYTFTVETAPLSTIPLPAAFTLYGAGVALLGLMGWKRKCKLAKSEFAKEKAV